MYFYNLDITNITNNNITNITNITNTVYNVPIFQYSSIPVFISLFVC